MAARPGPAEGFSHEALFYAGVEGFIESTSAFLREGVERGELSLVVVSAEKIVRLRDALGPDAGAVRFADMRDVGLNPARIIPAWGDFVAEASETGRPFRGIGEPIWAERTPEQLVEAERHEALLNLAFAGGSSAWRLLCPYDVEALGPEVLVEARRNHPVLIQAGAFMPSDAYRSLEETSRPFAAPLAEPEGAPPAVVFGMGDLFVIRRQVRGAAEAMGMATARVDDLVIAVNELVTNSVRHGGGHGRLRIWASGDGAVVEIRDSGRLSDPMAGRVRPGGGPGGRGLWMANQLCDLVQIRAVDDGTVIRLHMAAA